MGGRRVSKWSRLSRRRRVARWCLRVVIALALLLTVAWLVITQTPVSRAILVPQLERELGLEIQAGRLSVGLDGVVTIRDGTFSIPGVAGEAGRLLTVDRLVARPDTASLFALSPRIVSVEVESPVVRISQSSVTGRVNLASLALLRTGTSARGLFELPTLSATDARVEFGEHAPDGSFSLLRSILVDGSLLPARDDAGQAGYDIQLIERRGAGLRPLDLTGRLDADGVRLVLEQVALSDWPSSAVPTAYRAVYESLDLEGEIARTAFGYAFPGEIVAEIQLTDVSISLPFAIDAGEESAGSSEERARMRRVSGKVAFERGRVRAELRGILEDLPYEVLLEYNGTSPDSAFFCQLDTRDYQLERAPSLLPFAPPIVRRRLESFNNPTAIIDSTVFVERGPPVEGAPAPVVVRGWLDFRDATASYEHFPYPFVDLHGLVTFDQSRIEIVNLRGRGPTGAVLEATGTIAPPEPGAAVAIDIRASHVPVDEHLVGGMGASRAEVIEELFSQRRYAELVRLGLVISSGEASSLRGRRAEVRAELARDPAPGAAAHLREEGETIDRRLRAPEFDLGSSGRVDVRIRRREGDLSPWENEIDVHFAQAGLLPKQFPLPIVGEDLSLRIAGSTGELMGGAFRGLLGGSASIDAVVDLAIDAPEGTPVTPTVRVRAQDVPIDERLIHAIPDPGEDGEAGGSDQESVRRILRNLRLAGAVDAEVAIGRREHGGLGFDVELLAPRVTASPASGAGAGERLALDLAGRVHVRETDLEFDLSGLASSIDATGEREVSDVGRVGVRASVRFASAEDEALTPEAGEADPGWLEVFVEGDDADLAAPFEDLVGVFSPDGSSAMREARGLYRPLGVAHAGVRVSGVLGEAPRVEAALTRLRGVEIDLLEGRVRMDADGGVVLVDVDPGGLGLAHLYALRGPIRHDGSPAGYARLDGALVITPSPAGGTGAGGVGTDDDEAVLRIVLEDGDAGSSLVRGALLAGEARELLSYYDRHEPFGAFRAEVELRPERAPIGRAPAEAPPKPIVRGVVWPESFAFTRGEEIVRFHPIEGSVVFGPGEAQFVNLRGEAPTWGGAASGLWLASEDGAAETRVRFSVRSDGLSSDLRSLLADELIEIIETLEMDPRGTWSVTDGELLLARGPDVADEAAPEPKATVSGLLRAGDLSMVIGLPIAEAELSARFFVERDPAQDRGRWSMDVLASSLRYGGVGLTDARARLAGGSDAAGPLPTLIPLCTADCHGGRVSVEARTDTQADGRVAVEGEVRLSGVRLAPVVEELRVEAERVARAERGETWIPLAGELDLEGDPLNGGRGVPDESRGRIDAELGFRGFAGEPEAASGRGIVRVFGGRVLSLPLAVRLIEVSNFRLPTNEPIDFAQADFYLQNGRIVFEDLSAFSRSVRVLGYGTMSWPELRMDLRFNSQAEARIPLISDVFENLRDELVSTRVTGTPGEPEFELLQFPQTRRMVTRFLGLPQSDRSRRLTELRERAERARERAGRSVRIDRDVAGRPGGQE
ncbi:MAG: hypothetical protein EA378_03335 [Phycisphaerales bacterium]|nr:MAG: hypothetical protein EA378_03335 [Phycisphaerales bacterium]